MAKEKPPNLQESHPETEVTDWNSIGRLGIHALFGRFVLGVGE